MPSHFALSVKPWRMATQRGRRVGIAFHDIVGVAGNRHNAGVVVLFCDWEPPEMGMVPRTWVRLESGGRILVDTPLPPEAIEARVARR